MHIFHIKFYYIVKTNILFIKNTNINRKINEIIIKNNYWKIRKYFLIFQLINFLYPHIYLIIFFTVGKLQDKKYHKRDKEKRMNLDQSKILYKECLSLKSWPREPVKQKRINLSPITRKILS